MRVWARDLTGRQWAILAIAWCGWVFDIMDTAIFNFAKGPMFTDLLGGPAAYAAHGAAIEGVVQAIFLAGWSVGGLVFGVFADTWGRSRTLVLTVLLYCAFTGLTALCRTPTEAGIARFLTGLGVGGEWAAGVALVAEALPEIARAPAASVLQSAAAFGPIFAALANLALRGSDWRWLFLVGVAPAALCAAVRAKVFMESSDASAEETVLASGRSKPFADRLGRQNPLALLFRVPEWRRRAIVATIVGAVGIAGAGAATYWQPNLVQAASVGFSKADVDTRKSVVAMVSHVGTLAGVLVVPWLCVRFGRRPTIAAFYILTPAAVALAVGGGAGYGRLIALLPLVNFCAIGVSAAFVLYFPELFPAQVRATGAGLAYNAGRVLSIPVPLITGAAIAAFGGSVATGLLLTGAIYLVGLAALRFAPETSGIKLDRS
jgi:hypothetical protein